MTDSQIKSFIEKSNSLRMIAIILLYFTSNSTHSITNARNSEIIDLKSTTSLIIHYLTFHQKNGESLKSRNSPFLFI
ncbi:Uncharacterised protein [Mycobacteroides abscessus subsp. abscessus]|nr:Uncharacterised protein [Mycobacteroides abscessus subsp. abscessus]